MSAILLLSTSFVAAQTTPYKYFRIGSPEDAATKTQAGFALMGGGTDLDEAFRWMCTRAGGGDFLVLRATGDDDYNPYIQPLCKLNSVATLILPNRAAANDPFVSAAIAHAEAIFIAGGDQANYIRFWTGTPVQKELNAAIKRGVPIGGTSAGLAVMGEWAYSAEGDKPNDPNLGGKDALMDPLSPRVTLAHDFLDIPILKGIITDTHFARRDRMGRLLVFLSQIGSSRFSPGPKNGAPSTKNGAKFAIRGIGIEERKAVLVEPSGHAILVGHGSAYLVKVEATPDALESGKPLTSGSFSVQKVSSGKAFDISDWSGVGVQYTLTVKAGKIESSQPGGSVY